MSAGSISHEQLARAIHKHDAPSRRFYSDLAGKPLAGSVSRLSLYDPRDLVGEDVLIHGHAPASRAAYHAAITGDIPHPVNIFSVLDRSKRVIGQVTNLGLSHPVGAVDRNQLAAHLSNPSGGKTRNTFVGGTVTGPAPRRRPAGAESLGVKPGNIFIAGEGSLWSASMEPGSETRSPVLGRRAAFGVGSSPDRPSAWILRD